MKVGIAIFSLISLIVGSSLIGAYADSSYLGFGVFFISWGLKEITE